MPEDRRDQPPRLPLPERWPEAYGDGLFRYTVLRVGDRDTALDLVQDTFLAALKAQDSFPGHSAPRTWLIGILKYKIADHFRRAATQKSASGRSGPSHLKHGLTESTHARSILKENARQGHARQGRHFDT